MVKTIIIMSQRWLQTVEQTCLKKSIWNADPIKESSLGQTTTSVYLFKKKINIILRLKQQTND